MGIVANRSGAPVRLGMWGVLLLAAAPSDSQACMAYYQSLQRAVDESPLIVVGTVTNLRDLPRPDDDEVDGPGPWGDGPSPGEDTDDIPQAATVEVRRVLKGQWTKRTMTLVTGPVLSCSPTDICHRLEKGETAIFLLPELPVDGQTTLYLARSVQSLASMERIENGLLRGNACKAQYLAWLETRSPGVLGRAKALQARLAKAAQTWPTGDSSDEEDSVARAADPWVEELSQADVEVLIARDALAWLTIDPVVSQAWLVGEGEDVWFEIRRRVGEKRKAQVVAHQTARARWLLRAAGISDADARKYLAALKDSEALARLGLLLSLPYPGNKADGDVLTTWFLVRARGHYRAEMYPSFAMGDADVMRKLQPERLTEAIPMLRGCDGFEERWLAGRAIEWMPGVNFVDVVLADIVCDRPFAWRYLDDDDPKQSAARFTELARLIGRVDSQWAQAHSWRQMAWGECFHPACVDVAIGRLAELEKVAASRPADRAEPSDRKELVSALRTYLDAARDARRPPAREKTSAQDYRTWFAEHPEPKEDDR